MRLSLTCSTPLFLNQLGDTWTSDCNNCICEKESMSVQCTPVSCPVEPSPDCSDPGYKSVNKTVDCCLKETCGELRFLSHLKYHCNFQGPKKRIFATWLFVQRQARNTKVRKILSLVTQMLSYVQMSYINSNAQGLGYRLKEKAKRGQWQTTIVVVVAK